MTQFSHWVRPIFGRKASTERPHNEDISKSQTGWERSGQDVVTFYTIWTVHVLLCGGQHNFGKRKSVQSKDPSQQKFPFWLVSATGEKSFLLCQSWRPNYGVIAGNLWSDVVLQKHKHHCSLYWDETTQMYQWDALQPLTFSVQKIFVRHEIKTDVAVGSCKYLHNIFCRNKFRNGETHSQCEAERRDKVPLSRELHAPLFCTKTKWSVSVTAVPDWLLAEPRSSLHCQFSFVADLKWRWQSLKEAKSAGQNAFPKLSFRSMSALRKRSLTSFPQITRWFSGIFDHRQFFANKHQELHQLKQPITQFGCKWTLIVTFFLSAIHNGWKNYHCSNASNISLILFVKL